MHADLEGAVCRRMQQPWFEVVEGFSFFFFVAFRDRSTDVMQTASKPETPREASQVLPVVQSGCRGNAQACSAALWNRTDACGVRVGCGGCGWVGWGWGGGFAFTLPT